MQKRSLPLFICLLFAVLLTNAQSSVYVKEYIARFRDIAIEEMKRTGVPASITLAQGIHESGAGRSDLVMRSNNHFGIKCKSEWTGEAVYHDDDARGECFRKYPSPFDSYRDHSDFLKNRAHYAFLFKLDPTDYEGWAYGLKKAGYATNPKYPQIIIKLIENYNLHDYTLIALGKKEPGFETEPALTSTKKPQLLKEDTESQTDESDRNYSEGVFKINDTKVVYIKKGTSFLVLADQYNISLARLFEFNDMKPVETATRNQLVYLQRKRKKGSSEFHIVAKGETLHDIAQAEGIRLENLLEYNLLKEGMQPQAGEKIYLQGNAMVMPKVKEDRASLAAAKENSEFAADRYTIHTVQPRETLYAISRKYNIQVDELKKWNALESSELKTGQQLRINIKGNVNDQGTR